MWRMLCTCCTIPLLVGLLLVGLLQAGCSEKLEPPMFNYLACRQSKTLELKKQGVEPVAANLQAMVYCRAQQQAHSKAEQANSGR